MSVFIFILPFSSFVGAWGPVVHGDIDRAIINSNQIDSDISRIITQNKDYFYGCTMLPDISIFYYFSSGGRKYKATHNWAFEKAFIEQARTDKELACAYGIISHMVADSTSHNYFVPHQIKTYKLPNAIIHAPSELLYDSAYVKRHPEDLENIRKGMDTVAADDDIMTKAQNVILSSSGVQLDVRKNFALLRSSMTTGTSFFSKGWKIPDYYYALSVGSWKGGLFFLILGLAFLFARLFKVKFFSWMPIPISILFMLLGVLLLIGGFSTFITPNMGAGKQYVDLAKHRITSVFQAQNYDQKFKWDPTGWAALHEADHSIQGWIILEVLGLMGLGGLFLFYIGVKLKNKIMGRK